MPQGEVRKVIDDTTPDYNVDLSPAQIRILAIILLGGRTVPQIASILDQSQSKVWDDVHKLYDANYIEYRRFEVYPVAEIKHRFSNE